METEDVRMTEIALGPFSTLILFSIPRKSEDTSERQPCAVESRSPFNILVDPARVESSFASLHQRKKSASRLTNKKYLELRIQFRAFTRGEEQY